MYQRKLWRCDLQNKVKEFNQTIPHKKAMPTMARLMDISSELGELLKEYLKSTKYGTKDFEMTDDFELEFGDVLYSLLSLANESGINSELALDKVIQKYSSRIKNHGNMGNN